jgi:hypothetical protein
MTITTQVPAAPVTPAGTCRYPGCANPARVKDHDAPGRRPGYCQQEVPEDRGDGITVLVRHTAMTAFRRRGQLAGQPVPGRPVTAAVSKAAAIRDDTVAAMTRLAGQLTAVLDQLAVLGEQLAAAADPEAAEAQAEAVRAEAASQIEQARAEAASQASARHAAVLDAAEARAAAAEALTAMEEAGRAREQAEAAARDAARALHDTREAAAARDAEAEAALTAAREQAQAARRDAALAREHDQQRHAAGLAAATTRLESAETTITSLREQLARAQAALDRERAEQHKTTVLLHDLLTSRPGTAAASDLQAGEDPVPAGTGGKGTSRRSPAPQR